MYSENKNLEVNILILRSQPLDECMVYQWAVNDADTDQTETRAWLIKTRG